VSLRADGPAERECVAADVGPDVDGDRARLDEPWQLVDLRLTVFMQLRAQRAGLYAMLAS